MAACFLKEGSYGISKYSGVRRAYACHCLISVWYRADCARVLVKYEGLNVGGSIKTRTAWNMVQEAEQRGLLGPGSVIVEPTSGNQGIGLALVGAVRGYRTVIVMPDSVSVERRKLVEHYGAEVVLIHDDGNIGDCIQRCLDTALDMQRNDPNVFVPQQFSNPANPLAHRHHTALEILAQVAGPIDGFLVPVSVQADTITGIGEVLKAQFPNTKYGPSNRKMPPLAGRTRPICKGN